MKYSRQRELVLKEVGELFHPTAEEVFIAAKKIDGRIGIATVYRNLNQLASAGCIMRIAIPNQMDRFDSITAEHYHAVCRNCGKIIDLYPKQMAAYNKKLKDDFGFTSESSLFIVYGLCKNCSEKEQ